MTISNELLKIIACPRCKGTVQASESGERLVCKACGLAYPVREGIPVMLIEDAEKISER